MSEKVAFLCLGTMGYPMAGHLAKSGRDVTVWNRTGSRANRFVSEHGGAAAGSAPEAVRDADFVFVCTGNDDDLRQDGRSARGGSSAP